MSVPSFYLLEIFDQKRRHCKLEAKSWNKIKAINSPPGLWPTRDTWMPYFRLLHTSHNDLSKSRITKNRIGKNNNFKKPKTHKYLHALYWFFGMCWFPCHLNFGSFWQLLAKTYAHVDPHVRSLYSKIF